MGAPALVHRAHPPPAPYRPLCLDFYCAARKLAIEVDGFAHDAGDRPQRDEVCSAWLEAQGIAVLRIAAKEVLADLDSVADGLLRLCAEPLHHPALPDGPPPRDKLAEELR